ncbi:MAG: hypothetical protein R2706_08995 [Acidimicrobiales bacterium]
MKELVEACFERGLCKLVFATETLALGINMPARTVVIEKLTKWNGEDHQFLTPAQFTQLTAAESGRYAVSTITARRWSLWSPFVHGLEQVATSGEAPRNSRWSRRFGRRTTPAANLVVTTIPTEAPPSAQPVFADSGWGPGICCVRACTRHAHPASSPALRVAWRQTLAPVELRAALGTASSGTADHSEIAPAMSMLRRGGWFRSRRQCRPSRWWWRWRFEGWPNPIVSG